MPAVTFEDIAGFIEAAGRAGELRDAEIPDAIRIPHWPQTLRAIKISLGVRNYLWPAKREDTGLMLFEKKRHHMEMSVRRDGTFRFQFFGMDPPRPVSSDERVALERLRALLLFHQFQAEICRGLMEILSADAVEHEKVMKMAEEALLPFIPYLAADSLADWG